MDRILIRTDGLSILVVKELMSGMEESVRTIIQTLYHTVKKLHLALAFDSFVFNPITTQCCILTDLRDVAEENIVRQGEIACNKQFLLFS